VPNRRVPPFSSEEPLKSPPEPLGIQSHIRTNFR
jgi:hypothetical protein